MSYTRRRFLNHGGIAITAATQLSWLAQHSHAAVTDDYKALVCILLAGGADSSNILVPYDNTAYNTYANVRADLALPQEDLLPLNYNGPGGTRFGLHPGMPETQTLFDAGDLAFIANIGPLAEPTSRAAYDAGTATLPLGLFSHADQIAVWQTAAAGARTATGFGGRLADVIAPQITPGPISMNISMSGTNLFQTGNLVASYAIDTNDGVRTLAGYADANNEVFSQAVDTLLSAQYADSFRATYAQKLRSAIDAGSTLNTVLAGAPTINTPFSQGELSNALAKVAQLISVREALGVSRQTFFITIGGWDHHDEVINNQARMLPGISQGLSEFHAGLNELGVANNVVTFTISDFGRTLTSNGRGSDHGWGGHNLVMGSAVNGGQIYGEYPDLALGTELDLGRGRLLPTTSVDEFYAELALWFGIESSQLPVVLPNIERFYALDSGVHPLGFL
jgi:uncharacterized protein (DUF1501 family)